MPADDGKSSNLAATVTEVSERVTLLVREEIELAKAEVVVKAKSLGRGVIWFVVAGALGVMTLIFLPLTIAWLIDDLVTDVGPIWIGFAIVTALFLSGTVAFVFLGINKMRVGPPTPDMAIDEAKKIRETVAPKAES